MSQLTKWISNWTRLAASGTQALATETIEPDRVLAAIAAGAAALSPDKGGRPMAVVGWNCIRGFHALDADPAHRSHTATMLQAGLKELAGMKDMPWGSTFNSQRPLHALFATQYLTLDQSDADAKSPTLSFMAFAFINFFTYFGDETLRCAFEDLISQQRLSYRTAGGAIARRPIHFVQDRFGPLNLQGVHCVEPLMTPLPWKLPDVHTLRGLVDDIVGDAAKKPNAVTPDEAYKHALAEACRGLEYRRAGETIRAEFYREKDFTADLLRAVKRSTANHVASGGALEVIDDASIPEPETLGGLDEVFKSLARSARTYTPAARKIGLDRSRGAYFTGVQGTGKTQAARAASVVFRRITDQPWTVIRLNMDRIYGGVVGQTEANWREARDRIDTFGRCILHIDEVDKAFGDVMSASGDSGVRRNLFGAILGWLSDRAESGDFFTILTMNSPAGIPPELLRRVDSAGFFFDLPGPRARRQVLQLHLQKRLAREGLTLDDLRLNEEHWKTLTSLTKAFTPAEIEDLVCASRDDAFEARGNGLPLFSDLHRNAKSRKSSAAAVLKKDYIKKLQHECAACRPVTTDDREKQGSDDDAYDKTIGVV